MVSHMKTTVDIAEPLLKHAKRLAADEGVTLRELIEEGLRRVLARPRSGEAFRLRDGRVDGHGVQSGVNEGDWSRVREIIHEGRGG